MAPERPATMAATWAVWSALDPMGDKMKKILAITAASVLALAACGSDDDGGGDGGGGNSADDLVAALVVVFENDPDIEGVELDRDCLKGIADGLSEADRAIIIESLQNDTEAEGLTPEGEAAGVEVLDCIDLDLGELLEEE